MAGQFLQSTTSNFIGLQYGLGNVVSQSEKQYQDLISGGQDLCKRNPEDLNKKITAIIANLNAVSRILTSILSVLNKLISFLNFLKPLITGLIILQQILKLFPLPSFGTTVGVPIRLGDILKKISDQLKASLLIILGIDTIVNFIASSISNLLKQIQTLISSMQVVSQTLMECGNTGTNISNTTGGSNNSNSELANNLNNSLNNLNDNLDNLNSQLGSLLSSNLKYKGFTFQIIEEQTLEKTVAKRHYAVAINSNGIIILQGELSYASDKQVLIDELKLRIDNDNLSGYPNSVNNQDDISSQLNFPSNAIISNNSKESQVIIDQFISNDSNAKKLMDQYNQIIQNNN